MQKQDGKAKQIYDEGKIANDNEMGGIYGACGRQFTFQLQKSL